MKEVVISILLALLLVACTNIQYTSETSAEKHTQTIVGNDLDSYGCKASAGYTWCKAKQECIRLFETKCEFILDNQTFSNIEITRNEYAPGYIASRIVNNARYEFPLRYKPEELTSIKIEKDLTKLIKTKVYITKDPGLGSKTQGDSTIAAIEAGDVLAKAYNKDIESALTQITDKAIPQKTCSDTNEDTTIIYVKLGSENAVYNLNSCLIIEGKDGKGLIMSGEKLAYYLLSNL